MAAASHFSTSAASTTIMFKLCLLIVAVAICSVSAGPKPGLLGAPLAYAAAPTALAAAPVAYAAAPVAYAAAPVAYAAPAPAVVTAHSSQVIAQNFHGLAAPLAVPAAYAAYAPYAHASAVLLK